MLRKKVPKSSLTGQITKIGPVFISLFFRLCNDLQKKKVKQIKKTFFFVIGSASFPEKKGVK